MFGRTNDKLVRGKLTESGAMTSQTVA